MLGSSKPLQNKNEVSDKKLLQLWRDPNFNGSYRGIKTFQLLLKTDLNIEVTEDRLYKLLKTDPIFLIHQKPQRNFDRRSYDIQNYGELVQADLAFMFEFNGYKYFLLAIDCFSSKIFTVPLKSKESTEVSKAFKIIFESFGAKIYELETDQGKEFLGKTKRLFEENNILYRVKFGKNKANFAEHAILLVKRKLYMQLRGTLSQDWVTALAGVVQSLNETPQEKLGWLKPSSINSEIDTVRVHKAQKLYNFKPYKEPSFQNQRLNQLENEQSEKLHVNDFVYLDFDEKLFDKSFNVSVKIHIVKIDDFALKK
jgi:hypothetical protein